MSHRAFPSFIEAEHQQRQVENRDTTRCTNVSFRIARKPSEIKGEFPVLRVPVNPKIHNKTRERSRIPPSFVPLRFDRERKREKETSHVNAYTSFVSFDQKKKKKKKLGRKESDYLQWISSDRRETRVTQVDFNHTTIHFDDRASTGHVRISFEPTHLQLDRDPDRSDPYASGARGAATCAHGRLALGRSLGRLTRRWLSLLRGWPTGWMAGWFADCLPEQPFSLVARHSPCVAPPLRRMSKYRVEKVFDPRSSRHAVVGLRFLLRTEFDVSRRRHEFSSVSFGHFVGRSASLRIEMPLATG